MVMHKMIEWRSEALVQAFEVKPSISEVLWAPQPEMHHAGKHGWIQIGEEIGSVKFIL